MGSLFYRRWWLVVAMCLLAAVGAVAVVAHRRTRPATLNLSVDHDLIPANGYTQPHVTGHASEGRELKVVLWRIEKGKSLTDLESFAPVGADLRAVFRAGVTPGQVQVLATATGLTPARISFEFALDPSDEFGDGTPDFMRLQDVSDRLAFRRWFTFLAESTYFQKEDERPREVNDCAALIRYAYREALRTHDGPWANQFHLEHLPAASSVLKYDYPHTALGANIFRIRPGTFSP